MVRLQHHFALFTRTPGTTGDLGVKLGETSAERKSAENSAPSTSSNATSVTSGKW